MYARSDSVTTSGLGSEISDSDTRADDALSLCSGSTRCFGTGGSVPSEEAETESLPPDDGVFTEPPPPVRLQPPLRSTRPRPSSLLGKNAIFPFSLCRIFGFFYFIKKESLQREIWNGNQRVVQTKRMV